MLSGWRGLLPILLPGFGLQLLLMAGLLQRFQQQVYQNS